MDIDILSPFRIMDVDNSRAYIDQLYSNEPEKCFNAVSELKFTVIGSIREKGSIIEQGVVARLIQILKAPDSDILLKTEITTVLNSLAKGLPDHASALVQAGLLPVLWEQLEICGGVNNNNSAYTQMLLCCLRSIYIQGCAPDPPAWNHRLLTTLIQYGYSPPLNQECVANILASACTTSEQQQQLVDSNGGELVACMLCSQYSRVQLPALHCLAAICKSNVRVSALIVSISYEGKSVPDLLANLMSRDRPHSMQLAAAACFAYLYRADALTADDPKISFKTLQCLVRLCRNDCSVWIRIEAASILAHLTEIDVELQRTASLTDHLILLMLEFVKFQVDPTSNTNTNNDPVTPIYYNKKLKEYLDPACWPEMMREAALRVYASLSANDEDIRKRVIETDGLMRILLAAISNDNPFDIQMAAIRCLHSLSRSVQTLRTTFQDHHVWKPLMNVLKREVTDELAVMASSSLCNLLLEFSPSKESLLGENAIEYLCNLTRKPKHGLRLNACWALMNMAFQADHKVKSQILQHLGTDQIFRLLSDTDVNILMKTLGILRNLLSTKTHIDHIMAIHGKEIMQAIIMILEGEHSADVKEQALCILANIADGDAAKSSIMSNEDVLKKLMNYMVMPNSKLQIAATFCIGNLIWNVDAGSTERQAKLRELGVDKLLETLLSTTDTTLFDKVKCALDQFKPVGSTSSSSSSSWRTGMGPDGTQ